MFVLKLQIIVPIHAGLIKYDEQTDSTLENLMFVVEVSLHRRARTYYPQLLTTCWKI